MRCIHNRGQAQASSCAGTLGRDPVRMINCLKTGIAVIIFMAILSGCAPNTWRYGNQMYPSSSAALVAARADADKNVLTVVPRNGVLGSSARIVTPNFDRIRAAGVVKTGNPSDDQINYVAEVLRIGLNVMARAIDARGIFTSVTKNEEYDTRAPSSNGADYIIWFYLTDQGDGEWYIAENGGKEKSRLLISKSSIPQERVCDFVEGVETYVGSRGQAPSKAAPDNGAEKPPRASSSGTGFFVSRSGHLLTNEHVISGCGRIYSICQGRRYAFDVIASDPQNDLALLKAEKSPASIARFASTGAPQLGQGVVVTGFPLAGLLSDQLQLTTGVVSGTSGISNDFRFFQISAPVQQGNSGAPVIDETGRVIGVVVSKLNAGLIQRVTGDIPQNVNFAIKGDIAKIFLKAYGVQILEDNAGSRVGNEEIGRAANTFVVKIFCSE
ncbi:hypothetical protein TRIP_B40319 [uncultured Desulfatiglans sp.]|nr:hypothetical protein TRIP_B40319 [uncultured Desulfatiglans sp.]